MEWLQREYRERRNEIRSRLADFSSVKGEDVFYELCFCLLTPQSKGRRCDEAVQKLKQAQFFTRNVSLISILREKTRFHKTKAASLEKMKKMYPLVVEQLRQERDPFVLRSWLVEHVHGMGMKEASHFLRNIGYRGLAILDRHILRNLVKSDVLKELPLTLTSRVYLDIEQKLFTFSKSMKIPADELDLLFWSMETGEVFK
jgi:N-glycosylase/DNA lyase